NPALHHTREFPVEQTPSGWVWQNQQPLVIADFDTETRFTSALDPLRQAGITSYSCVPLSTVRRRYGALGVGGADASFCEENDLRFLQRVGELVALAIENVTANSALEQEKDRLQVLLEVNATLVSNRDLQELFPALSGFIRKVIKHDFASVAL